jgi:hypothetical protein
VDALPATDPFGVAREALLARAARGEVGPDEAARAPGLLRALAGWNPAEGDETVHLPLPLDEAEHVVPRLLFGKETWVVDRAGGGVEVVMILDQSGRMGEAGTMILSSVLGAALIATTGVGFFLVPKVGGRRRGEVENPDQQRLRVALEPRGGGVAIASVATQTNQGRPRPMPAQALRDMAAAVAGRADVVRLHYVTQALFGPEVRGPAVDGAAPQALVARLQDLGGPLAARAEAIAALLKAR